MTDIVTPIPIDALPPAPLPTDTPAEFDVKSFALMGALGPMVKQANASIETVNTNATAAQERSATATSAAATATAQADAAQAAATTAADKAAQADASAIAASKLNLGDKAVEPTTDNQGAPLRAGATYYDTTLNKWRVWTGAAWGDGISAVAGVSSLNGRAGDLTLKTVAGQSLSLINI